MRLVAIRWPDMVRLQNLLLLLPGFQNWLLHEVWAKNEALSLQRLIQLLHGFQHWLLHEVLMRQDWLPND